MTKVVYNNDYGGFGLSEAAMAKLGVDWHELMSMDRHDPRLVEVVETMGDAANTRFSELKIAEIEGDRYIVKEYDGMESVITPPDIDWVKV